MKNNPTPIEAIEHFCAWWDRTHTTTPKAIWVLKRALADATDGNYKRNDVEGGES